MRLLLALWVSVAVNALQQVPQLSREQQLTRAALNELPTLIWAAPQTADYMPAIDKALRKACWLLAPGEGQRLQDAAPLATESYLLHWLADMRSQTR